MAKRYVGWIFAEKTPGFKDFFWVQFQDSVGTHCVAFGYGRAAEAVAFFEGDNTLNESNTRIKGRGLGHIKLESTPLGLRVFVEEP